MISENSPYSLILSGKVRFSASVFSKTRRFTLSANAFSAVPPKYSVPEKSEKSVTSMVSASGTALSGIFSVFFFLDTDFTTAVMTPTVMAITPRSTTSAMALALSTSSRFCLRRSSLLFSMSALLIFSRSSSSFTRISSSLLRLLKSIVENSPVIVLFLLVLLFSPPLFTKISPSELKTFLIYILSYGGYDVNI